MAGAETRAGPKGEPMGEGIQKQRLPYGFYSRMSEDEFVFHVQGIMRSSGIRFRNELQKSETGVYTQLLIREAKNPGMIGRIGFERKQRDWTSMSDTELSEFGGTFIYEKGISRRGQLRIADYGLYCALKKRGLLDCTFSGTESAGKRETIEAVIGALETFGNAQETNQKDEGCEGDEKEEAKRGITKQRKPRGFYERMSDEELISFARRVIRDKGVTSRDELRRMDGGLAYALNKRKLFDAAGLADRRGDIIAWNSMDNPKLLAFAREYILANGIEDRGALARSYKGLYEALKGRKLLDEAGLGRKYRIWETMDKEELIVLAQRFLDENRIETKDGIRKANPRLHHALKKRGLLLHLEYKKGKMDWKGMDDDALVSYAQRFVVQEGVGSPGDLKRANATMYQVLMARGLKGRLHLKRKRIAWKAMDNPALVEYAKGIRKKAGVDSEGGLLKADSRLYKALRRRQLLDAVFFDAEKIKKAETARDMADTLESFGDEG